MEPWVNKAAVPQARYNPCHKRTVLDFLGEYFAELAHAFVSLVLIVAYLLRIDVRGLDPDELVLPARHEVEFAMLQLSVVRIARVKVCLKTH